MKVEPAKRIASNAIEQLRPALRAGHSERLKEYLAAMARFRRYSWHNVMLIASPLALARTISEQSTATTTKANAQNARSVRFSQHFSFSLRI